MNIKGSTVLLRAIEPTDNEMLLRIINDEETEYMLGGFSFPVSSKNQQDWFANLGSEKNTLRCMIEAEGKPVGVIMLTDIDYKNGNAEIHIKMDTGSQRGRGYGTSALKAMVGYAFNELRLHCLHARIAAHNDASRKLFAKCGFEEEGILRSRLFKRGKYIDIVSYSILNEQWLNNDKRYW